MQAKMTGISSQRAEFSAKGLLMKGGYLLAATAFTSLVVTPAHARDLSERIRLAGRATVSYGLVQDRPAAPGAADISSQGIAANSTTVTGSNSMLLLLGLGAVGLAAAAGAGGGGSSGSSGASDTQPPSPGIAPRLGTGGGVSSFETKEYYASGGLAQTEAAYRYAEGAYGFGTLVSVYDTGTDVTHPDLADNIDGALSYSYFDNSSDVTDTDGHGTHVAGIIAGVQNGQGIEGIAWGATLMILKGVGGSVPAGSYADAITRSVKAGSASMNNSWSYVDSTDKTLTIDQFSSAEQIRLQLGSATIDALDAAAKAGMVSVFAAGNDGGANPSVMAGLPEYFPEMDGSILGVVAVDSNHQIASFSNRCGEAMNYCLAAPGVNILSTYPSDLGGDYAYMSGTSMATPYVTGAVAVLKSEFPELTGQQIVQILETSATDLGAVGIDPVYGWGELNLRQAQAPAGTLKVETTSSLDGPSVPAARSAISASRSVAGALRATLSNQRMIVTDAFDRGYHVPTSSFVADYADASAARAATEAFAMGRTDAINLSAGTGTLSLSRGDGSAIAGTGWVDSAAMAAPYLKSFDATSALHYEIGLGDGLSASISQAGGGAGDITSHYIAGSLSARFGTGKLSMTVGSLHEDGGFLGTSVGGAFGGGLSSDTRFVQLGMNVALGDGTSLAFTAANGSSNFSGDGLLRSGSGLHSNAYAVGLSKTGFLSGDDRVSIGISTPISLASGKMTMSVPTAVGVAVGNARSDKVVMTTSSVNIESAAPQPDLQFGYSRTTGIGRLGAGLVYEPGKRSAMGVSLGWTARF
ncbi:hypothetical protein B6V74_13240 [Thioclava sp. F42-5]|nr:hypothetical protein B6V74_13240 [Thioclava sp. F42-5]